MTLTAPSASEPAATVLDAAARATVVERFGVFAAGWLAPMLAWTIALSLAAAPARMPAILTLAFQTAVLGLALLMSRRDGIRAYANAFVLGISLLLALSSIALFVGVGRTGELLGFVLFTLCAMAALLFPWGWRMELALTATVLGLFALAFPSMRFDLEPVELTTVIAIAAVLCVAIAEGHTRSFRAALVRRASEEAALCALAASRDTYRDITENARDFIWATDLGGRLTYINEAGARFLGHAPSELIGRNVDPDVTDHAADFAPAEMRARLAAGATLPPSLIQWRSVTGQAWVEVLAYAERGPDGEVIGFRGIGRDVTERWEAEAALRESEARYRGLVESQEELIYRAGLDGDLTFLNEACRRKYGVELEPRTRLNFFTFVHPDEAPQAHAALRTVVSGGRYRRTSRGHTPAGWRWIEWEVCAITDGAGVVTEIQGVGHDVTERRAADEALQRSLVTLREREEQLRLMGRQQVAIREEERKRLSFDLHDGVCQELVGIGILIEAARQRGVSRTVDPTLVLVQTYLRKVGEHVRLLARDLRPLQLSDLGLGECLRTLAAGMATETVHIAVGVPTTMPRLGEELEVAVYRVAQEALANAVRHAQARTITLTLGTSDGRLELEVRDDGLGFDREDLRSAALGLVAMEERTVALGGSLRVLSEPGAGTTVRLVCPLSTP